MCCKTNISAGFMSDDDLVNSDGSNGKELFFGRLQFRSV